MRTVLVTGCSSGFGRNIALAFARRGDRVYATVRTAQAARELKAQAADTAVIPIEMDVADPGSVRDAISYIGTESGQVDVLVNNAGIAIPGALEDLRDEDIEYVLKVNFLAPLQLTRAVLPGMRATGFGRIIMVSSLSALVGLPGGGIYSASKAALEAAAEGLRYEVDRFGIAVSVIEPGLFRTGMGRKIADSFHVSPDSAYAPLSEYLRDHAAAKVDEGDDPAVVAELVVNIAREQSPAFRYPAGSQAEGVVKRLRGIRESDRGEFIRGVQDTGWWSAGKQMPGSE